MIYKSIDKKTKGAWLIHHTNKLQNVTNQSTHEKTFLAGKAGLLLSAISASDQVVIGKERLEALAKASNINTTFELPKLVDVLEEKSLIDKSQSGAIEVLGITTTAALIHTSDIFDSLNPSKTETAAISIAEYASIQPQTQRHISEILSDEFELSSADLAQVLFDAQQIGFVDTEDLGGNILYFNGNLFRRDAAGKINTVLESLNSSEQQKLNEAIHILKEKTCVTVQSIEIILGTPLFRKICAIGLLDINIVSNSKEEVGFVTLPSAFSKFSNSMEEDAFDLTKALVSSLTYGMTKSPYYRGQIVAIDRLLSALIDGWEVGPASAIGQDYRILELKGVVQVSVGSRNGRTGPMMKLLKKEVGILAREALRQGDISEQSLPDLPSAAITKFTGPEVNREIQRRNQLQQSPKATNDMLTVLRTKGKI